ncbi:DISARM system helicase DrmA [Nocardia wallacei]|uniref:Helicase n=1 Tax=Nocardia wallacei TaxID=480035 RepID=A0A7G1KU84_9NOCA|nr:DISARM system helicase DrmA [Nocardia wallacei]BCK57499.1 helicase [Nocardia wallacei]
MTTTEPGRSTTPADAPAANSSRWDGSAYRLKHPPDGRSWTAREDLVDILHRELLGPAHGEHEILDTTPDSAYLIGRIAPYKLTAGRAAPTNADTGEPDTDVGDDLDAQEVQGVPVPPVDETTTGSDEDTVEDQPQKRGLVIPSSMGLRCQIPADLEQFTVTASWAIYRPFTDAPEGESTGHPRFQRIPFEFATPIRVADLEQGATTEVSLRDSVVLRIDRYDDDRNDRRVIEIALCNNRETPRKIPTDAWLYQTEILVTADGAEVFLPVQDPLLEDRFDRGEDNRLYLQYRNRLEFAIGRTCSVDWKVAAGARRASAVYTTWLPVTETPHTVPGEVEALLDMRLLAEADVDELRAGLEPIVTGYAAWLDDELARAEGRGEEPALPPHLLAEAQDAITEARRVHEQLAAGLKHLLSDEHALRCFRFMNEVMAQQRIHSQIAQLRTEKPFLDIDAARNEVLSQGARAHSWRTFQLAFVLMQLPMLTDPAAPRRSSDLAKAQLLFFPTGGGKTEAYLGLAAYTFAIRRLQGVLNTPDGALDGNSGIAVLMRYTLRLLTAQQFQRATALMCAAEMVRRADPDTWGAEPFRIGLWVGTDVSPKRVDEAEEQLKKASEGRGHRMTVLQIQRCPWCGNSIDGHRGDVEVDMSARRVRVFCSDDLAECPFSRGGSAVEGLPVLTVDEEIYRLAPTFLIATVDKFARLAREGEAAALFGYVSTRCERHGYVHPDYAHCKVKVGEKHNASKEKNLPAAAVRSTGRLRPPDLIIQDELHLITGALGTTVGLFESAIDVLCSWRTPDGRKAQPLIVASTATARNSAEQVKRLYGRGVTIFPPQVLDAGRTFFSREIGVRTERDDPDSSDKQPGRRYVGISTTGVRITTAQIRISEILLAAGQLLLNRLGTAADPYMTLVGYFSATRELAGMVRYLGDDVQTLLSKGRPWSLLPRRDGTIGSLNTEELTSRRSGADITAILDKMAVNFDPAFDATGAKRGDKRRPTAPYDAVLATSMLQVGVDVTRLGLMMVVGQPKNTAEYIQASSRVGRDPARPGLVVSVGNWARPRDLAHFEQFRHYHETFYAQVEALSVTPYSVTALDRGLDGVLVSAARVLQAGSRDGLSPEAHAGRVVDCKAFLDELLEQLAARMARASDEAAVEHARSRLRNRVDHWFDRRAEADNRGHQLAYEKLPNDKFEPLMMSAEDADQLRDSRTAAPFEVANSMREVQPEINLLVSPDPAKLRYDIPLSAPRWELPEAKDNA